MTAEPRPWHGKLFYLTSALTYLLVASGGLVCITDASRGCPDWPACHGRLIPPAQMDSIIEWSHRLGAAITLPLVLAVVVVAWRSHREVGWIFRAALGAVVCLLLVAWFGAAVVLWGLSRGWAAVDLGTALLCLALMVTAAVALSVRLEGAAPRASNRTRFFWPTSDTSVRLEGAAPRASLGSPTARLGLLALISVFFVVVGGVLVARPRELVRCIGWPSPAGLSAPADRFDWLQLGRLGLAGLASLLVLALVVQVLRSRPRRPALRRGALAAGALLLAASVLSALTPAPDAGIVVPVLTLLATEGLWVLLVAVTARAALEPEPAPGC